METRQRILIFIILVLSCVVAYLFFTSRRSSSSSSSPSSILLNQQQHRETPKPTSTIVKDQEEADNHEEYIIDLSQSISERSQNLEKKVLESVGEGPIIVGGVGDSGTRGARGILVRFGVQMPTAEDVNMAKDSWIFMNPVTVRNPNGRTESIGPANFYNHGFTQRVGPKYNLSTMSNHEKDLGVQWASLTVLNHVKAARKRRHGQPIDPWGWKHPRTVLLLPWWQAVLRSKWKLIFVIRDGRDIAVGDNQQLYQTSCAKMYETNMCNQLEFWAKVNMDIFNLAYSLLGPERLFLFRTEDFVSGDPVAYEALRKFVNPKYNASQERMRSIIAENMAHETSYFGTTWDKRHINQIERRIHNDHKAAEGFEFFGYKLDEFGLEKNFTEIYSSLFS